MLFNPKTRTSPRHSVVHPGPGVSAGHEQKNLQLSVTTRPSSLPHLSEESTTVLCTIFYIVLNDSEVDTEFKLSCDDPNIACHAA